MVALFVLTLLAAPLTTATSTAATSTSTVGSAATSTRTEPRTDAGTELEPKSGSQPSIEVAKTKSATTSKDVATGAAGSVKKREPGLFKESLETETDIEGWSRPGFRLSLSYSYGGVIGAGNLENGGGHVISLRLGARVDELWSMMLGFRYTILNGDLSGVIYAATVEPTFHPVDGLSISLGAGIGGMLGEAKELRPAPIPPGGVASSFTLPNTDTPLRSCSGQGVTAYGRVEYVFVVGHLFATGPAIDTGIHWTDCRDSLNTIEAETGEGVELQQFWAHQTWSISWVLSWR